jgi:hypothetical protein
MINIVGSTYIFLIVTILLLYLFRKEIFDLKEIMKRKIRWIIYNKILGKSICKENKLKSSSDGRFKEILIELDKMFLAPSNEEDRNFFDNLDMESFEEEEKKREVEKMNI